MDDITLSLNEAGLGVFSVKENDKQIGEMAIQVSGANLIAFHTEVVPEAGGKGVAKALLTEMVNYARNNNLKVVPLCPYVNLQFRRNPDMYDDIWNRSEEY